MNMFVGGAALAGASMVPESPQAAAPNPGSIERARPELRDAFRQLEKAYEALLAADATQNTAWNLYRDWESKNAQPAHPRAFKKWARRSSCYLDEIQHDQAFDAWDKAKRDYREAQHALGRVQANDLDEMHIKAVAVVAFEGGILEGRRQHLRHENQIVAFSIAMDAILLGINIPEPSRATFS